MANEIGWIKLHRAINDNPLWLSEPFNRAQAWVDLILNANFAQGELCVRGNIIRINRGEIGWSELTMASRWRWSKGKVRRFLSYLEISGNIAQQKSYITTVISICNYERYQGDGTADDTADRTADDTANGQQTIHDIRRREEEEGKEVKKKRVKRAAFTAPEKWDVANFFIEKGSTKEEAGNFWHFYESKGWVIGKTKMKSWTSAAYRWISENKKREGKDGKQTINGTRADHAALNTAISARMNGAA